MDREEWLKLPADQRIAEVGHRRYVGGADAEMWYGIGRLQYHFLVANGLRHEHRFLDVACGALRLGQFLIPYLDRGHYFGLDVEPVLVDSALQGELPLEIVDQKAPSFAFNPDFDVTFAEGFDFAIAQSLFTHLTPQDAVACLSGVRRAAHSDSTFFFTFFRGDSRRNPTDQSHPNKNFFYSFDELSKMAEQAGWIAHEIGDWNHPRNQQMVRCTPV